MKHKTNLLNLAWIIIAFSQIMLGLGFTFFPSFMYELMGVAIPTQGVNYILGMLAARMLVFGGVMFLIRGDLGRHRLWLDAMVGVQAIDLAAGVYHVALGAVALKAAAFPMANAALFIIALTALRPRPVHAMTATAIPS